MANSKTANNEPPLKKTKAQVFLEEWKRRRKADEEQFLQELNDLEHRKKIDALKGKIVRNGKIVSAS